MSQRISDPEQVLRRLNEVNQQIASIQQLLADLSTIKRRFDDLQATYARIKTDTTMIETGWSAISSEHGEVLDRLKQQIGNWRDIEQTLVTDSQRRLTNFETALRKEFERWLRDAASRAEQQLGNAADRFAALRVTIEGETAQVQRVRESLEATRSVALGEVSRAAERLAQETSAWQREYEDAQFRKIDNVLQSYQLIDGRQREAEAASVRQTLSLRDDFTAKNSETQAIALAKFSAVQEHVNRLEREMAERAESQHRRNRLDRMIVVGTVLLAVVAIIISIFMLAR